MFRKLLYLSIWIILLSSCISVSVDSEAQTPLPPNFVTATLAPTIQGFVPSIPTATPENTVVPTLAIATSANCKEGAILLEDVTIPDNTKIASGQTFTKTWKFMNSGTCPWINYSLAFASGDIMNAPITQAIPATPTGAKVDISVELTAPTTDGLYTGYFTLNNADGINLPIGAEKTFWVKIVVGNPTPQATNIGVINTPYKPNGGNSNCAYSQNAGYVQELLGLINLARTNAKVNPLTLNSQLSAAAQAHSADMACNNFLDHTGSDGSWIRDRISASGYGASYFAEIIAIGSPQNAINQWAADQPHWDLVIDASLAEIGIGYAYYTKSDFGGYWTVDLGMR